MKDRVEVAGRKDERLVGQIRQCQGLGTGQTMSVGQRRHQGLLGHSLGGHAAVLDRRAPKGG